jgi:SpoIIAA-like
VDLKIETELQGNVLFVTATGTLSFEPALRLWKEIFDTAAEKHSNSILANALAVDGVLTTYEWYSLALELIQYLKLRQMNPKIAVVGNPPTIEKFGVLVAQTRGMKAEVFSSQQEALKWLAGNLHG